MAASRALMPTLTAALAVIPKPLPLNIELKRRSVPATDLVRAVLAAVDGRSQVLVSSFDWEALEIARSLAPDLALAPLSPPSPRRLAATDLTGDLFAAADAVGAFSLHCSRSMVDAAFIRRARARGYERLLAYTVNDREQAAEMFRGGLAGIFTDVPSMMVESFHPGRPGRPEHRAPSR